MDATPGQLADDIDRRIRELPDVRTDSVRALRREYSRRLRQAPAGDVLAARVKREVRTKLETGRKVRLRS